MVKKFSKKQKIQALKNLEKRHPKKKNLLKNIIKNYETGLTGEKKSFSNYDIDKDGVPNHKDCNPYDPKKQDFARGYTKPRTYRGYNVDDYYYSGGEYHLSSGAEKEEKKGFISRLFK